MQKIKRRCIFFRHCQINGAGMLVGASVVVIVWMAVCFAVGVPLSVFHYFRGHTPLMARWLYLLADLCSHAVLGAAIGIALCNRRYAFELQKYRGAFYFVLAIVFGYLFNAFFFGMGFFLVAFVLAAMEVFGLVVAMLNFCRFNRFCSFLIFCGCIWGLYRMMLAFFCFFVV